MIRNREIAAIVERIPIRENFSENLSTGQWVIMLEGCLLMGIILVAIYAIFVSFRKQVNLNKLQDSILSSVTHELKTPLASIRLYTETLLLRPMSEAERTKFIRRILSEADRLQKLIDCVLISARVEAEKIDNIREETDLISMAHASWQRARERFGEKREFHFTKNVDTRDGTFIFNCNPLQVPILIDNLLDNAVKYTDDAGKISMTIDATEESVKLCVSDNGLGIEKPFLKKVFQKFYRVDRNSRVRVNGSGLGLFVCESIVKSHGGRIYAQSEGPGKGASFHVEFERYVAYR